MYLLRKNEHKLIWKHFYWINSSVRIKNFDSLDRNGALFANLLYDISVLRIHLSIFRWIIATDKPNNQYTNINTKIEHWIITWDNLFFFSTIQFKILFIMYHIFKKIMKTACTRNFGWLYSHCILTYILIISVEDCTLLIKYFVYVVGTLLFIYI